MSRKTVSRREFLKRSTLALGGGCLGLSSGKAAAGTMGGGGGMGGGGTGGGGTGTIDPPPGAAFRDPVEMSAAITPADPTTGSPRVVSVSLEAVEAPVDVNGVRANLLTYNGHYPAPTIRVKRSDLLKIDFTNSLPMSGTNILGHDRQVTNLHTHGLHVSPSGIADNMMRMFMSGESADYEYDLSVQEPGTLNFYHPHVHGTVAEQYWGGLAGALVVEDETDALSEAEYETHLMVIRDIALSGGYPAPHASMMDYMRGKEGGIVTVNGQVNPVLPIRPGQVQRWRILNACNARFMKLGLEGHSLNVVGTGSGLLDKPYPVAQILLSPGERIDVLVKAGPTKRSYRLLSLAYNRGGGSMGQQVTLLTLSCKGSPLSRELPASVNPGAARVPLPPIAKQERMTLSMGQGRGYVNGITFTDHVNAFEIHSRLGTWEIWEVVNQSGMDHPFHQHVNPCQVLSITGGDAGYASLYTTAPAWKDVVIVPKWGSVRLLVPVMDYPGMTMFHCHIIEHEDIGMMGVWHIMENMDGM